MSERRVLAAFFTVFFGMLTAYLAACFVRTHSAGPLAGAAITAVEAVGFALFWLRSAGSTW